MRHGAARRQLSAWLDGEVSPVRSAEVESHLQECVACRRELRELRAAVGLLQSLPHPAPPPRLRVAIRARLDEAVIRSPGPGELRQRVAAWLQTPVTAPVLVLALGLMGVGVLRTLSGPDGIRWLPGTQATPVHAVSGPSVTPPASRPASQLPGTASLATPRASSARPPNPFAGLPPGRRLYGASVAPESSAPGDPELAEAIRRPRSLLASLLALSPDQRDQAISDWVGRARQAGRAGELAAALLGTQDPEAQRLATILVATAEPRP